MSTDQVLPALWRSVAGLLLGVAPAATAHTVRISAARLAAPGMSIEGATFELDTARATAQLGARARLEPTGDAAAVKATCALAHAATGWRCAGEALLEGTRPL